MISSLKNLEVVEALINNISFRLDWCKHFIYLYFIPLVNADKAYIFHTKESRTVWQTSSIKIWCMDVCVTNKTSCHHLDVTSWLAGDAPILKVLPSSLVSLEISAWPVVVSVSRCCWVVSPPLRPFRSLSQCWRCFSFALWPVRTPSGLTTSPGQMATWRHLPFPELPTGTASTTRKLMCWHARVTMATRVSSTPGPMTRNWFCTFR